MKCTYHVNGGDISSHEAEQYFNHGLKKYGKEPKHMEIKLDGDFVDIDYSFSQVPFQRIRRITGYLVGTLDRFNNSKHAEVQERVKHDI